MVSTPVLTLYSCGKTTGIALESGYTWTKASAVYDGFLIQDSVTSAAMGGSDVTKYLAKILADRGYEFRTASELDEVRNIKEKFGYAAIDFDTELSVDESKLDKIYELPDGQIITIGKERFLCVETMFKPQLLGIQALGVPDLILEAVKKTNGEIQEELLLNIVCSGGNVMFEGFSARAQKELALQKPSSFKSNVFSPVELPNLAVWIGGSILSTMECFRSIRTTKGQYDEFGSTIVHRST
jgi:actin-related protein